MNYRILIKTNIYLFVQKFIRSNLSLEDILKSINLDDYIIIKSTNKFKIIDKKDIEKYAGFLIIKKDEFDEDNFNRWIDWIKNNVEMRYLAKPFPDFDPFEKIKEI